MHEMLNLVRTLTDVGFCVFLCTFHDIMQSVRPMGKVIQGLVEPSEFVGANASIHLAPEEDIDPPSSNVSDLEDITESMKCSGHRLAMMMRGHLHGLSCERCGEFYQHRDFDEWRKACRPKAIPRHILQYHERRQADVKKG